MNKENNTVYDKVGDPNQNFIKHHQNNQECIS